MFDPRNPFAVGFRGEPEVVSVLVGGQRYTAFTRVQVRAAFDEAARSFRLEIAAEMGANTTHATFKTGMPVQIFVGGDLVLDGFIEQKQPSFDADSASIAISGRSKSADLIDSSAIHDTGSFENQTLDEIGNAISDGLSARFLTEEQLEQIPGYQLTPGKSVYRTVEELARQQGLTITGTPEGNAKLAKAGKERHAGGLFEGRNIKAGSSDHNESNRHSRYIVRGQRPLDHGVDALEIEAIARDAQVGRNRPVVIIEREDTSKGRAKSRAKNRKDRAAGNGLKARITVPGFRDDAGKLWTPGHLIWVESPFLDIAQDMLVESVDMGQDSGGSLTALSLVDPRAYGGKGGKGNKSGDEWSMDDSDAE